MDAREQLSTLDPEWDMIVVGGGITGAGVAREAARRKLKVLLVEQQDFAWGTSSRSSKMVHGGLRYLASGDFGLTRDALQERERLLKEAPGLIERMGYYYLLPQNWLPMKTAMRIILSIYDRMAGVKEKRSVARDELQRTFPSLHTSTLKGAAYFTDTVTDDSRLVQRVLGEAQKDGAVLRNYCRVERCTRLNDSWQQVELRDTGADEASSLTLKARVVVNSTGAWADILRGQRCEEQRVRPLKGSHLILKHGVLPLADAVSCSHPVDRRSVFVFPWLGHTVIGTTDLDYSDSLNNEAAIDNDEVDYLLAIVAKHFPNEEIGREHVISTWSGVRPVIASDKDYERAQEGARKKPSSERRDHAVWDNDALITASGGKLTTFRLMALDVLEKAAPYLSHWTFRRDDAPVFSALTPAQNDDEYALQGRYGVHWETFMATQDTAERTPIDGTPYSLADCRWALQQEMVLHLDDLLLRRTHLGQLLPEGGAALLPTLEPLCKSELGWSDERWQRETARYQDIWTSAYSLPVR